MLSQETTIIRDYGGKRVVQDPTKYRLAGSSEQLILIQHYELISDTERDNLVDIIIQNIDYYLDQVMEISEGKMTVRKSDKQILKDLQGIVDHNIKLYDYQVDKAFPGFSDEFLTKIQTIEQLNWDPKKGSDGESRFNARDMAYNYVQGQISELKGISTSDLRLYADNHIHEYMGDEAPLDMAKYIGPLDTGEWVINSPLIPIDYSLASIDEQDIALFLEPDVKTEIPSGTDGKIVELLESNNKLIQVFGEQMINLQQEMVALRKESNQYRKEFGSIREEILGLQEAIVEIRENNSAALSNPGLRELTNEKAYVVQFAKNSDHIALSYQMELNEVYHIMMIDQSRKVMITGYADTSGNPQLNAQISRYRALNVKSYLRGKGIPTDRMVVNFLGDSASNSENAADRKVEIAWLGN